MGVEDYRVIVLLGPTASGKTGLSLKLAEEFPVEILSADSRLFYRGMDIGTAKPTSEERARAVHHLIDVSDPDDPWSLERYLQATKALIAEINNREHIPLVVGGTGQYITALIEGWEPPPRAENNAIREKLQAFVEQHGAEALHLRLQSVDPQRAEELDPRNVRRVIRALEIYELTGKPASSLHRKNPPPYRILRIGLNIPRADLYRRIDERIAQMLADGWVEEVEALLEAGYSTDNSPMSAIGYPQIAAAAAGEISLETAVMEIKRITRTFVRRQANWFKLSDENIHWLESKPGVEKAAADLVRAWLAGNKESDTLQDL